MPTTALLANLYHDLLPFPVRSTAWHIRHHSFSCGLQKLRSEGAGILGLFDQHRCVFVHVPKSAGTSVAHGLFGKEFESAKLGHAKLRAYEVLLGRDAFATYFKFAFVRNPWDRVVSAYEFLKQGGTGTYDVEWTAAHIGKYPDFRTFVQQWITPRNIYRNAVFVPQWEFVMVRGKVAVDFLGHYESLHSDFSRITRQLGLTSSLEHRNRSMSRKDYRNYYDAATRHIIDKVYRKDIEVFDYVFD